MTDRDKSESTEDLPPKRVRGRRVGVQQMRQVFIPQLDTSFDSLNKILSQRFEAKKTEVREIVCEGLGLQEIIEAGAKVAKKARDKYVEANKIEEEAKELERQAKALVNASKIIEMNMEEERRSYYSSTKHTKRVKGVTIEFSEQFNELVDAAMMVQKEHMDLEWLKHQRDHYKSTLGRSITMEQAVETLGEVESLIKALENEHKELLEKQEEKNARTKRVCSEWEEGDAG